MGSLTATSKAADGAAEAGPGAAVEPVSRLAPAKINLYLHVTGRRQDGYHLLDSLFAFVDVGDVVDVRAAAGQIRLTIDGPFARDLPDSQDNLVMKAARSLAAFAEARGNGLARRGAEIRLTKSLPVASGIGGGSADAAAALHGLNMFWSVGATLDELRRLAEALGADIPACLHTRPIQASGVGEQIVPAVPLPDCAVVLANPGLPLLTAAVFKAFASGGPAFSAPDPLVQAPRSASDLAAMLQTRRNDLEGVATRLVPDITTVLDKLRGSTGCLLARLSGSGPTCFGLFADASAASRAAQVIAGRHPTWWVRSGAVLKEQAGGEPVRHAAVDP